MSGYDVLVTGAEERQGLAVIRALGRKGLRVMAAGSVQNAIGFSSRFANGSAVYTSPQVDTRSFSECVSKLVNEHGIPMVMPSVESTVIALDEHRGMFSSSTKLALPPSSVLAIALDKRGTYEVCDKLGICIPRSCYAESTGDGLEFADTVGFPIVMKPRAQATFKGVDSNFEFKVRYALNKDDLKFNLEEFDRNGAFPILQEYCSGDGVAHSFLVADGIIRGLYQHRRVREYPITGGVASVIISEKIDPQLADWTEKLMADVSWDGVAQVEYRHDIEKNRKVLIEVNGRFWAPLSGALQLGLNFPYALYEYIAFGNPDTLPGTYPEGRRFRYLRGDLIALEGYLRGDVEEGLQKLPGKVRAIWDVVRDFGPGVSGDISCWDDRGPVWHECKSLLNKYSSRLIGKLSKRRPPA